MEAQWMGLAAVVLYLVAIVVSKIPTEGRTPTRGSPKRRKKMLTPAASGNSANRTSGNVRRRGSSRSNWPGWKSTLDLIRLCVDKLIGLIL